MNNKEGRSEPRRGKEPWRKLFHSDSDFEDAPPPSFAIEGFLQNHNATLIAGLSGHGKSLVVLALCRVLLGGKGTKLWNEFEVQERARRVIYITPEVGLTSVKSRLEQFGLAKYLNERFFLYTLSRGPAPKLDDSLLLDAAEEAHIFLDPAIRFGSGDENSSADNQMLAEGVFGLLRAGARSVTLVHHSPKRFANERHMSLENMVRGTGDLGAMFSVAWGLRQLEPQRNVIQVENIKARDFEPCDPFQIIGRPYIEDKGDFRMHKPPGKCGPLARELGPHRNRGGAPHSKERDKNVQRVVKWIQKYGKTITGQTIVQKFKKHGLEVARATAKRYRRDALEQLKGT